MPATAEGGVLAVIFGTTPAHFYPFNSARLVLNSPRVNPEMLSANHGLADQSRLHASFSAANDVEINGAVPWSLTIHRRNYKRGGGMSYVLTEINPSSFS